MRTTFWLILTAVLVGGLVGILPSRAGAEIVEFQEDFSTWEFRDAALTTADWDTLAGRLHLFPVGLDSLGWVPTGGLAYASALTDTLMFVADGSGALLSFGVGHPSQANLLDTFTTIFAARDVAVAGSYAYVSVGNLGVQAVNIGDPGDLVGGGTLDLTGFAYGLTLQGTRLYVAQSGSGVAVVSIATPSNPTLVANAATMDWARDVAIRGTDLLVADNAAGLTVMDISLPDAPQIRGNLVTSSACLAVSARNNLAFLACGSGGLVIADISDPTDPQFMSSFTFPGNPTCRNVTAVGDTLYAAVNNLGLYVLDVHDPYAPVIIASHNTPGAAYQVSVNGTTIWVADEAGGMRAFELNPLALNLVRNLAVSTNLVHEGEPVIRARLAATTTDSVRFDLTVDGGQNWLRAHPGGDWVEFPTPGENFRWRAALVQTEPGLAPTCSVIGLTYEKLHGYGGIESVADVPNDTGGQVRLIWGPSRFDVPGADYQVTEYSIYRRYDPQPVLAGNPSTPYPPGSWDFITSVPADMESQYAAVVPTFGDSTQSQGMFWSVYFLRTRTTAAGVFFDSPPDSGYSLNNLQPDPPTGFIVDRSPAGGTQLSWNPTVDPDFAHFRIYRAISPVTPPQPGTLFQVTTGTAYFDADPGSWYYQLTLVNLAGLESEPAFMDLTPVPAADRSLELRQNAPNPFNPLTRLSFLVPVGGAEIRLEIFDSRGHLIRVLLAEFMAEGEHTLRWDGRDDQGRLVGSGVYHGRIQGAGTSKVVKMVLVR